MGNEPDIGRDGGQQGMVVSDDGTEIVYERQGNGPAVILVGGAFTDRSENAPLAVELATDFTVYNYDRRGRGESGDTPPYAVAREIEDLEALLAVAGSGTGLPAAHVYGVSSGGALVLRAVAAGVPADRVAVYEVPYGLDDDIPANQHAYVEELEALLAEDRRGDAAALFMRYAGATDEMIEGARNSPLWPGLEAVAPSLRYDAAVLGNGQPPTDLLSRITRPTLVATGDAGDEFFGRAADALLTTVPNAERALLPGQSHRVDPKVLAPVLRRFFNSSNAAS